MNQESQHEGLKPLGSSLAQQRQSLRLKMQVQRSVIAQHLGPARADNTSYPRSHTMRFLTQRPGLAIKLLTEFAALFVGAGFLKSVGTAMGFAKIFRSGIK